MSTEHHRPTSRSLRWATVIAFMAVLLAPIVVAASDRFTDVPSSNVFHDDISWLAQNGVTRGCNPPANDRFCPDDEVTRAQMSAFMRRLAEGEVVAAGTAKTSQFATNAENLDSFSRNSLLGAASGNQQFRDRRLAFSPAETLNEFNISATESQGLAAFVQLSGFFVMSGVSPTSTDHQFLCWISPTELNQFNPSSLPNGYWWKTYPAGSVGVATSVGPQHSIPFTVTYGQFLSPGQSVTLYTQCADAFAGSAPVAEEFTVRATTNAWGVRTDLNAFQPVSVESFGDTEIDSSLDPAIPSE